MFQTVEDKFPASFVLPYLVPMLENAGAVVMLPRERDTNPNEVIVDNDLPSASSLYAEEDGTHPWHTGTTPGFAHTKTSYTDFDNPFTMGTYKSAKCTDQPSAASTISWTPTIPERGDYAVYVTYTTMPASIDDAQYTVYHAGGHTTFKVNQQMGGGTWVYLGTFTFSQGTESKVVLTNLSNDTTGVITADAVRFGGGMGNIARYANGSLIYSNTKQKKDKATTTPRTDGPKLHIPATTSGYPRYAEGARYYLQWAGMPDSIYTPSGNRNDYTDDYKCRGKWVNYLAGGSTSFPDGNGLHIPLDLSFAFHTDAGTVGGDKIIGTLGIYQTTENGGRLGDGTSRLANKTLCELVCNSIVSDIRQQAEPEWSYRNSIDRRYNEASVPRVPSMLLELMSHENFADMRYGLDPRFRFIVSRAIYKGILKFLSQRNGYDYVVQPLPVANVAAEFDQQGNVVLSWDAVNDSLETTAAADSFMVYMRRGNGGFDNGRVIKENHFTCKIPADEVVSFKITALNAGGQSMPSEILSVGRSSATTHKPILIINGFDRLSAPDDFVTTDDAQAGFLADKDNGVAQGMQIDYIGKMKEFRRAIPWTDDDSPGFGDSYANEETHLIAGNTFDYPYVHGTSLLNAGFSFTSMSKSAALEHYALTAADSLRTKYSAIDLILGKQKQCKFGRAGINPIMYKTFSTEMQAMLTDYCKSGGSLFVSGAYIATDLWHNPIAQSNEADKKFASDILKYQWRNSCAAINGKIKYSTSPLTDGGAEFEYHNCPNSESYAVESPDAIIPSSNNAFTAFRYSENNQGAGIAFCGSPKEPWRTAVLAFPFESIKSQSHRDEMIKHITRFLIPTD